MESSSVHNLLPPSTTLVILPYGYLSTYSYENLTGIIEMLSSTTSTIPQPVLRVQGNMALFLVLALIVSSLIVYYCQEWVDFNINKVPPGPTSLPFIGNILQLKSKALHHAINDLADRFGSVFSIKMGRQRVIMLNDAQTVKAAYNGPNFTNRPSVFSIDFFVNKGFMACQNKHDFRIHTKLMKHAFQAITYTSLGDKLVEEAQHLMERFESYGGRAFNPREDLNLVSLNILHNIAFGKRYEKGDAELQEIFDYSARIMKGVSPVHPVNLIPWLQRYPNPWMKELTEARQKRDDMLLRFYEEHRESYTEGEIRDMVDALIKVSRDAEESGDMETLSLLSPLHIITNIWTIFFAGTDTIHNALLWVLLYMAVFPKVQERVQEEIDRVIGERTPCLEDEQALPYLCATFYETLRFSSLSLLGVPHAAVCDTTINGYHVPAGTQVLANFWAINRDKTKWHEPDEFRPERFLDDNGQLRNMKDFPHFMPFSTGRRACLGKNIGKSEVIVLSACLLQRMTVTAPEGEGTQELTLEPEVHFDLVPKQYSIVVKPRDGTFVQAA
ncbi:cytochrome P450 2J4-like [Diadema antillarum]|uniref:cytochrome P450 2J4-like n=1 Tax=Diadema antillarum TaxID=105358 RepID=UPI003A85A5BB